MKHQLTDDQYLEALKRIKGRIEKGLKLKAVDSDIIGDKFVDCSWGLCSMDAKTWPEDTRFKRAPFSDGRVSSKQLQVHHKCPMNEKPDSGQGCFYSCRVFQRRAPTKEQAVEMYQAAIDKAENGKKTYKVTIELFVKSKSAKEAHNLASSILQEGLQATANADLEQLAQYHVWSNNSSEEDGN